MNIRKVRIYQLVGMEKRRRVCDSVVGIEVDVDGSFVLTVKSCIKAAVYVQFFHFSGRLLHKTGLCAAVVQLLAAYTVQSMHAESQHCVFYT